jgi:hypothetical protein
MTTVNTAHMSAASSASAAPNRRDVLQGTPASVAFAAIRSAAPAKMSASPALCAAETVSRANANAIVATNRGMQPGLRALSSAAGARRKALAATNA